MNNLNLSRADARHRIWKAKSREAQLAILEEHLGCKFEIKFGNLSEPDFPQSKAHSKDGFIADRKARFIRSEDNSIRGFPRRFQVFANPEDREQFLQTRLARFILLPTPLPPQFTELAGYNGEQRFAAIYYQGTKPTVTDGISSRTFSFYRAYSPLTDHPAISYFTAVNKAFLGADDGEATHVLLFDTANNLIYLAQYREAMRFLQFQLPQTVEEENDRQAVIQKLIEELNGAGSLADFQKLGMFDFFAPEQGNSELIGEMTLFLDQYIPEDFKELCKRWQLTGSAG